MRANILFLKKLSKNKMTILLLSHNKTSWRQLTSECTGKIKDPRGKKIPPKVQKNLTESFKTKPNNKIQNKYQSLNISLLLR